MKYTKDNPLRLVTLCSGYDSQCLAMERLKKKNPEFDYTLVAWSEIDKYAIMAHDALFPQWKDKNLGDMTKIDWSNVEDFDMLFYSTPCFVAGTLVLTAKGYKPIENIEQGDMVITHTNKFRKVVAVGSKHASEILKVRAMMCDEIFCTPNHPFYTREMYHHGHKWIRAFREPSWKAASKLTKNDYLGLAINTNAELPEWNGVKLHRGTHWDSINKLSEKFESIDFWYLMGRYVGDGWQRDDKLHKCIVIACTDAKRESLIHCINSLEWNYTETKENTCGKITICNKELCEFVGRYGKYAHGKHIDSATMNLPTELLKSFLDGYIDSDGCFYANDYKITTVSRELAYGLMQIVAKCLHRPSRLYRVNRPRKCVIDGRECNQRDTYTVCWHNETRKQDKAFYEDGYCWYPIKEVSNTDHKELVYNMEVEEDHSYTANGAIVHNCQSISQAGLQHGFIEGSGTRSSIIWNVRDAVRIKRPKYLCLENVAAMVSSKFIGMFNLWQSELQHLGYMNFPKVLNAKDYGVPQNRDRIFLLSIRDDGDNPKYYFPKPIKLEKRLKDVLEEKVDEKYYLSDETVQKFIEHCDRKKLEGCGFKFEPTDGCGNAKTITSRNGSRETDNYINDYESKAKTEIRIIDDECLSVSSDDMSHYTSHFAENPTLREFVEWILTNNTEDWGVVEMVGYIHMVEYSNGKVDAMYATEDDLGKKIRLLHRDGGWNRMDYTIEFM